MTTKDIPFDTLEALGAGLEAARNLEPYAPSQSKAAILLIETEMAKIEAYNELTIARPWCAIGSLAYYGLVS